MSIKNEMNQDFTDSVRTIMATNTHPAQKYSKQTRISYLKAIAIIAYADEEYHPLEKKMLKDLAEVLNLDQKILRAY